MHPKILFSEQEVAARVTALAKDIAASPFQPQIAVPILVGSFVFAADLLRALAREGYSLPVEFLWLRSYVGQASGGMKVLVGPSENVRGKNVLIIDGVLDGGHTIKKARDLVFDYGASQVRTAVIVDKQREDAVAKADYAGYAGVKEFIVGYGMDDGGKHRSLPYIALAE